MTNAEITETPTPNEASEPGRVLWDVRVRVLSGNEDEDNPYVYFTERAITSQRLPGLMRKSAAGTLTVKLG